MLSSLSNRMHHIHLESISDIINLYINVVPSYLVQPPDFLLIHLPCFCSITAELAPVYCNGLSQFCAEHVQLPIIMEREADVRYPAAV